jgi:hypothetical protein
MKTKRKGGKKCKASVSKLVHGLMVENKDELVAAMLKNNALFKDRVGC